MQVSALRAALEAEYDGAKSPIIESCPAPEDTFTTRPYPRRIMPGTKAWQSARGPKKFVSIVAWKGIQLHLHHTAALVRVDGSIIDQHLNVADLCLDGAQHLFHALRIGDVQPLV